MNLTFQSRLLKQNKFDLLIILQNHFFDQFCNTLKKKINSRFEYIIMNFSKICNKYTSKLLPRKYSLLKITVI